MKDIREALSSVRLFLVLAVLIALVGAAGTLIPQNAPAPWYEDRLGALATQVLSAASLDHVYSSWWFAALLAALGLNLAACSWKRRSGRLHALAIHAGLLLILAGALARSLWGVQGQLTLEKGATIHELIPVQGAGLVMPLPFSVTLEDFKVEYDSPQTYWLMIERGEETGRAEVEIGRETAFPRLGLTVKPLKAMENFVMDKSGQAQERSSSPDNPALQLELGWEGRSATTWVFEKFPGMEFKKLPFRITYRRKGASIRNFVSRVTFSDDAGHKKSADIRVNAPFSFRGHTFYQSGYDPDRGDVSILLATRDPGVPLVFLGFAAVLSGMALWIFRG